MMDATFSTFILPCLGFMFLPFTTLMYVFLVQGVGTAFRAWTGCGCSWRSSWTSPASAPPGHANRNRIPAGYPGSYPPDPPAPQA